MLRIIVTKWHPVPARIVPNWNVFRRRMSSVMLIWLVPFNCTQYFICNPLKNIIYANCQSQSDIMQCSSNLFGSSGLCSTWDLVLGFALPWFSHMSHMLRLYHVDSSPLLMWKLSQRLMIQHSPHLSSILHMPKTSENNSYKSCTIT